MAYFFWAILYMHELFTIQLHNQLHAHIASACCAFLQRIVAPAITLSCSPGCANITRGSECHSELSLVTVSWSTYCAIVADKSSSSFLCVALGRADLALQSRILKFFFIKFRSDNSQMTLRSTYTRCTIDEIISFWYLQKYKPTIFKFTVLQQPLFIANCNLEREFCRCHVNAYTVSKN